MTFKQRIASWAIKSLGDRMTADQLVTSVFGSNTGGVRMGSAELLKAYSTMPWLRAAVGRISWQTASVPWQLYVATAKPEKRGHRAKAVRRSDIARSVDPNYRIKAIKALRRDDSIREITTHPALDLLDHGNPRFPGQVVRQVSQQHLDLIGEAAWLIERNAMGVPIDIYPIPPTWIAQTPWSRLNSLAGGEPGEWIIYSNRGTIVAPKDDVIYFYHPDPYDPYDRGRGTGHALGDELETDEATAKHLKRWFKNFAIPPLIISKKSGTGGSGGGTGRNNTERLEESWLAKLMGRNNVPYFSSAELSVHELNQTFNDMQLSQLRKDERDILIHVYGMPPEVFGIIENSNRSTIDAADYLMAKYVVVPRLEFQRIILQQQLIERYDERLILDYVSPIAEDREFELKVSQAHPHIMTIDEIRELANKRKLEDGIGEGFMTDFSKMYVKDLRETSGAVPAAEEEVEES